MYYNNNYRRNYRRRPIRKRRRTYQPKTNNFMRYAGYAYGAYKLARATKKLLNVESKHFFFDVSSMSAITNTGKISCINQIPAGDTSSSRDGNTIRMTSVTGKFIISQDASKADNTFVRCILFICSQQDATDIIVSGAGGLLRNAKPFSLINLEGDQGRLRVLWDQVINIADDATINGQQYLQFHRKLDHKVIYAGSATASPRQNSLYLLLLSDAGTNQPACDGHIRVRYLDN